MHALLKSSGKRLFPCSGKCLFTWTVLIAFFVIIAHVLVIRQYGYFRDELYYIACSDHPDFGYVDQPPFSLFLLKVVRLIGGDSLIAIRLLPALGAGLFVFMGGLFAFRLGGKSFAMTLAALAAAAPIGNFIVLHFYSMNFLDILFWQALILILIEIVRKPDPRLWILFGFMAGVGLMNKISVLFPLFGMMVGLVMTKQRFELKRASFWAGMGIAGVIFLPYIIWNIANGMPTLEFMNNARTYKMTSVNPLEFFQGQILYNNPATLLLWLPGLCYFFFHPEGKRYRVIGWIFVSIYILMTVQQGKDYYLAGAYPVLFAGGAVLLGKVLEKRRLLWPKPVLVIFLLIPTLLLCPMALPVLPVEKTVQYLQSIGISGQAGERHEMGLLPQHFADMHGWKEMAGVVIHVYEKLTPEEKERCFIFLRNYGEAGAVDFWGKKHGLPEASCMHNSYWFWGPPDSAKDMGIIMGESRDIEESREDLLTHFDEVEYAATFQHRYCMPYESSRHFFICRKMKKPFGLIELWKNERNFI